MSELSETELRPAKSWGDALSFINLQSKEIEKLRGALKKCVELCVCQTESEMFIDEAKEALGEK